jgi:hypothetical protein
LLALADLHDADPVAVGEAVLTFHDPDTAHRDGTALELEVDRSSGVVRVNARVAALSLKEFVLVAYLYDRLNKVTVGQNKIAAACMAAAILSVALLRFELPASGLRAR